MCAQVQMFAHARLQTSSPMNQRAHHVDGAMLSVSNQLGFYIILYIGARNRNNSVV